MSIRERVLNGNRSNVEERSPVKCRLQTGYTSYLRVRRETLRGVEVSKDTLADSGGQGGRRVKLKRKTGENDGSKGVHK